MDKSMQGSSIFGSSPVKNSESAMRSFNTFGVTRIEPSNSSAKLKLKATDKLISFSDFGYICEDAPLTRGINPKTVERTTLRSVDFTDCSTLTELCEKAVKELVQDGADSDLAQLAIASFIMSWGKRYYGLTPVINFVNLLLECVVIKSKDLAMKRKKESLHHGFTTIDIQICFEHAVAYLINNQYLESPVSEIKDKFRSILKSKIYDLKDTESDYIIKDVMDSL